MKLALVFKVVINKKSYYNEKQWGEGFEIWYLAMAMKKLHTSQFSDTMNCYTKRSDLLD